jgi:hypothetical protein
VCEIELLSAPKLCQDLKVVSQNDRAKLEEAKTKLYREGFTYGIMRVGEHSGKPGTFMCSDHTFCLPHTHHKSSKAKLTQSATPGEETALPRFVRLFLSNKISSLDLKRSNTRYQQPALSHSVNIGYFASAKMLSHNCPYFSVIACVCVCVCVCVWEGGRGLRFGALAMHRV